MMRELLLLKIIPQIVGPNLLRAQLNLWLCHTCDSVHAQIELCSSASELGGQQIENTRGNIKVKQIFADLFKPKTKPRRTLQTADQIRYEGWGFRNLVR